ncbi:unnamed protein product [Rotaria sp. Silwood1]|nr:unnamed protein product [Rotaria sp. Silwood1]
MSVTNEQKQLLQSTVSAVREQGKSISTKFYEALFQNNPEYRNFLNETNVKSGKQGAAIIETVCCFIENIDNLDVMMPQMSRLSSKHRAVTVQPEHYPTLGKHLLQTIKEHLGNKATPEVMTAYEALLGLMSSIFIKREKELYSQLGNDKGFIPFNITKKETISSGSTCVFTMQRQDGGKPWPYTVGQYITIRIEKDSKLQHGHYMLLEPDNGSTYSIACREGHVDQNIIVSEELIRNRQVNSTVLVSGPAGSFGLVSDAGHHLFIAGGIGIASLMGMINALNRQGKANLTTVVQCVQSQDRAAFADQLQNMLPKGQYVMLTKDTPISKNHLEGKLQQGTHVYVSGSETFLDAVENVLAQANC